MNFQDSGSGSNPVTTGDKLSAKEGHQLQISISHGDGQ